MGGKGKEPQHPIKKDSKSKVAGPPQQMNTQPSLRTQEDTNELYAKELLQENERLQNIIQDLWETSKQNKQLLDDYLSLMSDKDGLIWKVKDENDALKM